jgi:predicted TIM-barrel fold metal-dependent hydrolase
MRVIDVHYHYFGIFPDEFIDVLSKDIEYGLKRRGSLPDHEELRRLVRTTIVDDPTGKLVIDRDKRLGIHATCINTTDMYVPGIVTTDYIIESSRIAGDLVRNNPGRLFAFAGVDPRRPEAVEVARMCLNDFKMIGIKWHPDYGYDPTSPQAYEVLKVLNEHEGILLIHTGYLPGGRSKYTDLNLICDILVDFPGIKVIAAHMGKTAWHEWAGLAHDFPNLYGDLAVWSRYADRNYDHFCRQLRELTFYAGIDKVLWGTDDPFENYTVPTDRFIRMMKDLPDKAPRGYEFSREEVALMLGGNAARLLGLGEV